MAEKESPRKRKAETESIPEAEEQGGTAKVTKTVTETVTKTVTETVTIVA